MMIAMSLGENIQNWRLSRGVPLESLATAAAVPADTVTAIESGDVDPSVSTIEAFASALKLPTSWLFSDPKQVELLTDTDDDGEAPLDFADPIVERILTASRSERELFVLLTALLQRGEPKLWRAAEMSLRSLLKQARQAALPWQSRPSGHFEPPSD
jgi:transcriptional regulator with XRE-family HTH domain